MKITFGMVAKRFLLAAALMTTSCLLVTGFTYISGDNKLNIGSKKSSEKETEKGKKSGYDPSTSQYEDMGAYTICLDPAAGGNDEGNSEESRAEKDDNLTLAKKVKDILVNEMNFKVEMTRTSDEDVSDEDRVAKANDNNCNALISLSRGSYINANYSKGFENYIFHEEPTNSLALSSYIMEKLNETGAMLSGSTMKGKPGNKSEDYYTNKASKMASVVVLTGYVTSDEDNEAFDNNTDAIATAIAEGIYNYFKNGVK
ncbi:N-acetylmuramoyl-L-alanine amidase [Eubacterium sp.]|uniref:N-acetylmuramoyl-L-alanine amidase family protein n=1 Tax=Eubacterium sp. TaxID=142586 RepID=UPI0025D5DEDE|nr:N-acetylmuramoyl-L-alanine amidase [Eubacterium sp.]MCR5628382.1 N-acetylmuramoyl-L-alanine amidase [Eubacterium sp.]